MADGFGLDPGKLGFKIGEVLVGLRGGTRNVPETISSTNHRLHVEAGDFTGRQSFNTVFGDHVVGFGLDDVSVQFQYNNSTYDVWAETAGSGAVTNSAAVAAIGVGSGPGTASLTSRRAIRYRPGREAIAQFSGLFEGAAEGVDQFLGVLDNTDGLSFGTKDGVFGCWFVKGGIEVFYPQLEWLGDKCDGTGYSEFVLDPTKMNIYMVSYGWLGTAPLLYSIYTGVEHGWVLVHWMDQTNTAEVPHLGNPSLPVAAVVRKTSESAAPAAIESGSWRAGVVTGPGLENDRWFSHSVLDLATVAGDRNNLVTLRNKSTFQSQHNHVVVELGVVAFDNSVNRTVVFAAHRGATQSGGGAFAPVDVNNSVIETSTGGTVTGGVEMAATVIRRDSGARSDVRGTGLVLFPDETVSISAFHDAAGTGTVSFSARWAERF